MPLLFFSLGMAFKLPLSAIVLLALLLPQVQSKRVRFFGHKSDSRGSHHESSAFSHGSHLTRKDVAPESGSISKGSFNIQMVNMIVEEDRPSKQQLGGMLNTPVSTPNPAGNAASLATIMDTPVSSPNPGGNAQILAVSSGPYTGGNPRSLAASSGPNPGGNSEILMATKTAEISIGHKACAQNLAASSGPNPSGNAQILAASSGPKIEGDPNILTTGKAVEVSIEIEARTHDGKTKYEASRYDEILDTPVSGPNPSGNNEILISSSRRKAAEKAENIVSILDTADSGPNTGGNSASLTNILDTSVSGPNPSGNSEILAASLTNILDTPVSAPNPSGNSEILAASSGPKPGGNTQILAASSGPIVGGNSNILMMGKAAEFSIDIEAHKHDRKAKHEALQFAEILDTPVSAPNPTGNSEILVSSSRPKAGGKAENIGSVFDTAVSGPIPGGSPANLANILDTPVSSPSPTGNSEILAGILDTPVSGPNPGGNAQELAASSRQKPGGDLVDVFPAYKAARVSSKDNSTKKIEFGVLDTRVSGPNSAGSREFLFSSSSGDTKSQTSASKLDVLTAVSGPNPGGNSAILASSADSLPSQTQSESLLHSEGLDASSGANPGGNAHVGEKRESFRTKEHAATSQTLGAQATSHAERQTFFNELPRAPVPPSSPSPIHDSVITSANFATTPTTKRRAQEEPATIGCNQERKFISNMFDDNQDPIHENAFPQNAMTNMGIASRLMKGEHRR